MQEHDTIPALWRLRTIRTEGVAMVGRREQLETAINLLRTMLALELFPTDLGHIATVWCQDGPSAGCLKHRPRCKRY